MLDNCTTRKLSVPGAVVDLMVYTVLLFLGGLVFCSYLKTADLTFDATYVELARSLLERHTYVFNFLPETMLPPGFPMILAVVCRFAGFAPAVLFHVLAVFATFDLIISYELLRRVQGRALAGGACLLLGFSPSLFSFVTRIVFSEMLYLFFSMIVLLSALKVNCSTTARRRAGWILLLSMSLIVALLLRSVGVALLLALGMWILSSYFVSGNSFRSRVHLFVLPIVLGAAVQFMWAEWTIHHQAQEWSLAGWPNSYTAQLRVKDGNDPELGMAQLRDIPIRVGNNLRGRASGLFLLLTGRETATTFWTSPFIVAIIVFITVGLTASLLQEGGQLHDWYFLCHETIFLLWPWEFEMRFLIPVAPLACLYLWRGARKVTEWAVRSSYVTGCGFIVLGTSLTVATSDLIVRGDGKRWQLISALLFWCVMSIAGCAMLSRSTLITPTRFTRFVDFLRQPKTIRIVAGVAMLLFSIRLVYGLAGELEVARLNSFPDIYNQPFLTDVQAAQWIRLHEPVDSIVMARKQDLLFHYTRDRVVWFPPISNPQVLMEGIRRHHISLVVVVKRREGYWLPTEEACFKALVRAYPAGFELLHAEDGYCVFKVKPNVQQSFSWLVHRRIA